MCDERPCDKHDKALKYDSFISHRNILKDFEKVKSEGIESYKKELNEKIEILKFLLNNYNDGRKKSFYCLAVNLLELEDVRRVMIRVGEEIPEDASIKERSAMAAGFFKEMAKEREIQLKLNKKI